MSAGGILVTGGAGFIGSHLVRALLARGEPVTVYDNLSVGRRENVPAGADLVAGDVTDGAAIERVLPGHRAVVHLAARVAIRSSFEYAVEDTHANVVGTAALMRAVQRSATVRRVVAASSMAVYADSATPVPLGEDHPTRPMSPYGISKLALEHLVHRMGEVSGVGTVVLRLFNTYGSGQALSPYVGVTTIFAHAMREGRATTIFGDGEQSRDFVHVSDVVQALLLALDRTEVTGETFNVGTGVATSVNRLHELVALTLGHTGAARREPAVPGELRNAIADLARIGARLGYRPARKLEDALPAVVLELAGR